MSASLALRIGTLALSFLLGCARDSGRFGAFGSGLPRVAASPDVAKLEREMFARLNRDRAERGLPALRYDDALADVGRFHSRDMRDNRFFAHDSPTSGSLDDRLNAAGYLFLTARENLAEAPDVQTGEDALLRSPGHYANIVATDTTHVGIGIVRGGVEARENLTMTQVFARPGREESPSEARKALVRHIQAERRRQALPAAEQHEALDELARLHIAELDAETSPSSLQAVGERVVAAVNARKDGDIRSVVVGAQLLADSESFEVSPALVKTRQVRFGLAVRQVPGAGGRPMLQLLLLVGL